MANDGGEAEDLAQLGGALVINMGSATPESISHQLLAIQAYNKHGGPVLFDPVGAGATNVETLFKP
jgi:thiamine-phosphate diphosphorylase/hydroxyethylthiazole kinase